MRPQATVPSHQIFESDFGGRLEVLPRQRACDPLTPKGHPGLLGPLGLSNQEVGRKSLVDRSTQTNKVCLS